MGYADYDKFMYSSADTIVEIRDQFKSMTSSQSKECLESVIDWLIEYELMPPVIDSYNNIPNEVDGNESNYNINIHSVGIKKEDYEIVDTDVVALFRSRLQQTDFDLDWVDPDLPDYDHQILVYTYNNVIYSSAFSEIRTLTYESLKLHLMDRLARYLLEYDKESIEKDNKKIKEINLYHKRRHGSFR